MDEQLYALLLHHFAVKMKDGTHSSEDTYRLTGLTQNKVSQYLNERVEMPRASRIAMAQNILHSRGMHQHTHKWLDKLSAKNTVNDRLVKNLIGYIEQHGHLDVPRGRTEAAARKLLRMYNKLTELAPE